MRQMFRIFRRSRGEAIAVVVTLALGVGAATAMFSVTAEEFLARLPWPSAGRVVYSSLPLVNIVVRNNRFAVRLPDANALAGAFSAIGGYNTGAVNVSFRSRSWRVGAAGVTAHFFSVFRIHMRRGRAIAQPDAERSVVVLSSELARRLGLRRGAVGSTVNINGRPFAVIGVAPAAFSYPRETGIWLPFDVASDPELNLFQQQAVFLQNVACLRGGVTIQQAGAAVALWAKHVEPGFWRQGSAPPLVLLRRKLLGSTGQTSLLLAIAAGLLLAIASLHAASLLMAWASDREGEAAIRATLGGGRYSVVLDILTDIWPVPILGAAGGALLAIWAVGSLRGLAPTSLLGLPHPTVDWRVLLLSAVAATVPMVWATGFIVWRAAGDGIAGRLHRSAASGAPILRRSPRGRRVIVAIEVAAAVSLIAASTIVLGSFNRSLSVPSGFHRPSTLLFNVNLPTQDYRTAPEIREVYSALRRRLLSYPGVQTVAVASQVPVDPVATAILGLRIQGHLRPASAYVVGASRGYFAALGIPVLKGDLASWGIGDTVVINAAMARKFWPQGNPLGAAVSAPWIPMPGCRGLPSSGQSKAGRAGQAQASMGRGAAKATGNGSNTCWARVAAVVGNVRDSGPNFEPTPTVFLPWQLAPSAAMS
ncbi:MAG: ABC transporter permease, partial [Terriglobales bacterium]